MIKQNKKSLAVAISLLMLVGAVSLLSGCAGSQDMTSIQQKADQAMEKADMALQEAQAAKSMSGGDIEKAEAAAARAEST